MLLKPTFNFFFKFNILLYDIVFMLKIDMAVYTHFYFSACSGKEDRDVLSSDFVQMLNNILHTCKPNIEYVAS